MGTGAWVSKEVTAPGLDKMQAAALAIEFWTSKGFEAHSSAYNRLVLRRSGFGKATPWVESLFGVEKLWHDMPLELTVLVQFLPTMAKYELKFEASAAWNVDLGNFKIYANGLVDEFIGFINQWMSHSQKALEK